MSTAAQRHSKTVSEVRNVSVDMRGALDAGELLTGTPTIVEVTSTDLTLDNKRVNTGSVTINQVVCIAGQAVQFRVAGGVASSAYTIRITVGTNATPAQTLVTSLRLYVTPD